MKHSKIKIRRYWKNISPVTKVINSKKIYERNETKKELERVKQDEC